MSRGALHTVTIDGQTFTRRSPRVYTHAVAWRTPEGVVGVLQWSMKRVNAEKTAAQWNRYKEIRAKRMDHFVVPVTRED